MPKTAIFSTAAKIVYPPGCKDINEELTKDELVRRLKLLARAFQDMGQDENNEFKQLALFLATEFFLDHPNKDIKLLVACCIADIFRIFAPEAPYTDTEHLKEIFLFLTQQLRGLEDPDSPSFKRYFYLLENLAWVKSFNICIELDDNQEIFCALYKLMFSIVNAKHSNKVVNFMLDMMVPLITEADMVSQELLDIILINIIEPHKTQKTHAYNLAKDLIRRTANAIEPYMQTFFNNALMLGKISESEVSGRLYDLIYELNGIAPSVLLAVLPQLEFKLKTSDDAERKGVSKLLAKMFSDTGSDLAVQNKPLWICFLGRFNDIDVNIRRICVQASQDFIVNHPDLVKDLEECLKQRQHDPDENVRMDVIQAIVGAAKKEFGNVTQELLDVVRERTLDKKFKIRKEGLMGLGAVYRQCTLREDIDKNEVIKVAWIRDKVMKAYYQTNLDDRILVERILNTSLVPYSLEPDERMRRLYVLYGNIDDHATKALQEIFKTQANLRNILKSLLELHSRSSDNPEVAIRIKERIVQISRNLPDSTRAVDYVKKFNKLLADDTRVRASMIKMVNSDCPCKKAEEYVKEVLKKTGNPIPHNMLYTHTKMILERVAPVMIDRFAVLALMKYVDDAVTGIGEISDDIPDATEKGMKLLLMLSFTYPGAFQDEEIFTSLMGFVKHEEDSVSEYTMQIFTNIGSRLEATFPNIYSSLLPFLQKMVKIGTPRQAKYAIRCISALCRNKERIFVQIFEHLQKNMKLEDPNFLTSLVSIGHMAYICPAEFAASVKGIVSKFIVKELLMQDRFVSQSTTESWYADHLVSEETQAKIQALKMMVRWLMGLRSNANNSGASTLRLLHTLILHEGDLMERGKVNKAEMARLRLEAGCCVLKLAQEQCYEQLITLEQYQATALLLNDPCLEVRRRFAQKLHKGLQTLRLPLSYMAIFCLVANDPLKERKAQVKQFLISNIQKRRDYLKQNKSANMKMFQIMPDYVLPYAIHLLAHDPDFVDNNDVETLKNIKECLWFIMEPLITKNDNYSYSFYKKLIENIKQTKDAQDSNNQEANHKMYAVCDLALGLVMTKTSNFVLKDFPGEPLLPAKLFTQADQNYSNIRSYLPPELSMAAGKPKKPIVPGLSPIAPPRQSAVVLHASDNKPPDSPSDLSDNASESSPPQKSAAPSRAYTASESEDQSPKVAQKSGKTSARRGSAGAPAKAGGSAVAGSHKGSTGGKNVENVAKAVAKGKATKREASPIQEDRPPAKRGRPKKKVVEEDEAESDEESEVEEDEEDDRPPAFPKKTTARGEAARQAKANKLKAQSANKDSVKQGKITDFVTRTSSSKLDNNNSKSGRDTNKSKDSPLKKDRQSRSTAPVSSPSKSARKRTSSGSSSVEPSPSPVKRKPGRPPKNAEVIPSPGSADSVSSSPAPSTPRKRGRPAASASTTAPPANAATKSTRHTNVRSTNKLLNGTSDGESGTPDSKRSTPRTQTGTAATKTRGRPPGAAAASEESSSSQDSKKRGTGSGTTSRRGRR